MIEVEVKAAVADPAALRRALRELGAVRRGELAQVDTYYSHPLRRFELTDEALRIRVSSEGAQLTYKGPRLDRRSKSREEVEVPVGDPAAAGELLRRLGFRPAGVVRKRRTRYSIGELRVCVDRVEGLGLFVEVEKRTGERSYRRALESALGLLSRLGGAKSERSSYLELLLLKRARGVRGSLSSRRRTP
ncbi:MAG: class IV adenylate cyclase [Thermoplasmatota archaeon]